jgi:hypothetical protein
MFQKRRKLDGNARVLNAEDRERKVVGNMAQWKETGGAMNGIIINGNEFRPQAISEQERHAVDTWIVGCGESRRWNKFIQHRAVNRRVVRMLVLRVGMVPVVMSRRGSSVVMPCRRKRDLRALGPRCGSGAHKNQ